MDISSQSSTGSASTGAPQKSMAVIVKVSGGSTFTVEVNSRNTTIGDIKILAEPKCKIPRIAQRIFFKGKVLNDSETLAEKDVPASGTLFLVKNLSVAAALPDPTSVASEGSVSAAVPVPCAGKCGFYGSPALKNYCSKCHKDLLEREEREKELAVAAAAEALKPVEILEQERADQTDKSRCWRCTKKIGLTGVKCRCGYTFCASHRYAESHECEYDYKTNERRKLVKQNPVVQADKMSEKA